MRKALAAVVVVTMVTMACKQPDAPPPPPVTRASEQAPVAPAPPRCQPGERTCVGDDVVQCKADGSLGATLEACKGACRDGACVDTCALRDVELIYVVDDHGTLSSFDPRKLPGDPFQRVAKLACNPQSSLNSMAVDRAGVAWLDYHDGKVFRASITDGHCAATGAAPRGAPKDFGMGFVSDGPKATTEKLFVAGGHADEPTKVLATLDTSVTPPTWNPIGTAEMEGENAELTGTGDGRLFAYFPSPGAGFVQELDRSTGRPLGPRWTLDARARHVSAYAFAHWGGVFYVFVTLDGNSTVRAIHMKSGAQELVMDHLPAMIVGAGVSTCAPLLERAP